MVKGIKIVIGLPAKIANLYSNKQIVWFLLIAAFIIRCLYGFIVFSKTGESQFMDSWDYIFLAENMLDQGMFPLDVHKWSREIGPGYSWIIAVSFYIFGKTYWPLILLNVLASTGITWIVYNLTKQLYNKEMAIVVGIWSVLYVQFFKFTPVVLKECLVIFLFALTIYQVVCFLESKRKKGDLIVLILTYAMLIHIDERYFFYLPFYCLALFVTTNPLYKKLILSMAFVIGVAISIVPWTYRNYLFYDRLVILTERTAKFTDPIFGYPPLANYSDRMSYDPANHLLYEAITDSIKSGYPISIRNVKFIPDIEKAIQEGIEVRTFSSIEHYWEEFKELWRPAKFSSSMVAYGYRYQEPWSYTSNIIFLISYGTLLPFLAVSILLSFRRPRKGVIFLIIIIVVHTIIHVFLAHARERYRIPIDPIILTLSLPVAFSLISRWAGFSKSLTHFTS